MQWMNGASREYSYRHDEGMGTIQGIEKAA